MVEPVLHEYKIEASVCKIAHLLGIEDATSESRFGASV
jgi:hypothetical protein